jgi:hypothetical protein
LHHRTGVAALLLAAAACAHSEPFASGDQDPLGPPSADLPRQLTFNPGDDRSPQVTGDVVAYSRYDPARGTSARCIAVLPAGGGTLRALSCPPPPSPADTFVSTWLEPTLAPDGDVVGFVWQRGARVSALAAWSHDLAVAALDSTAHPGVTASLAVYLPDGRFANTAYEVAWAGDGRLRFLAAFDSIIKVKGGGASRFTDTTLVPRALMELEVATGTVRIVPGGDSARAWAADATGAVWVVLQDTLDVRLWRLAPDGGRTPGATLPVMPTDLTFADGRLVFAWGSDTLFWGDAEIGGWQEVPTPGRVFRLAAAGGRRIVVEVERGISPFGEPANLWLLELPAAPVR